MAYLFDVFEYVTKRTFERRFIHRMVSYRQVTDDCSSKGKNKLLIQR